MQQHPRTATEPSTPPMLERELPMLAGIGAFVTWCEDLLNILSGPVITAGLVIALVALLTDGDLLVKIPAMTYIWAVSMALGVDAQFVGSAAKAARAIRQRRPWAAFGYFVLCGALGYVGYIASNVFATQEAQGITMAQALQHLGMDGSMWIFQRSFLAVILVFLSGFLRYVAPGKNVAVSTAEEKERLEAELELEPLRAQLRQQKVRDMRAAALTAMGRDKTQPQSQTAKPRLVAASQTLPLTETLEHHIARAATYKELHDGNNYEPADPWANRKNGEIDDEVYDAEADSDLGASPWATGVQDEKELAESAAGASAPNSTKQRSRAQSNSGARRTHQQASKQMRETHKKMRLESKQARKRQVREGAFAIFDELAVSGESLSLDAIGKRVREMYHLETTPSNNTIMRLRGAWNASRAHKAALDAEIEPMEPQELRELVAASEAW